MATSIDVLTTIGGVSVEVLAESAYIRQQDIGDRDASEIEIPRKYLGGLLLALAAGMGHAEVRELISTLQHRARCGRGGLKK